MAKIGTKKTKDTYYDGLMKEIEKWEKENGRKITGFGFRSIEYSYAMQHQNDQDKKCRKNNKNYKNLEK